MRRPVLGLCLDRSPEMPHVERSFRQHIYDSSIEPCIKKSKPDYPTPWPWRGTSATRQHEVRQENCLLRVPQDPNRQSVGGAPRFSNDSGVDRRSESFQYHSSGASCDGTSYNKDARRTFPEAEKFSTIPRESFSETSSAFIGPALPDKCTHPPEESPCFKITTVELGKTASKSKGEDGIDYELRQFYKELNELQPESPEQTTNVIPTVLDVQQHLSPSNNSSLSGNPHIQTHISQPFTAFPNKPAHVMPFSRDPRDVSSPQVKNPPLPLYNPFRSQTPYNPPKPFFNHTIPPPGFEGRPPPPFIVPYGPSLPPYNTPFPRQNNLPPPLYKQPDKYNEVHNVPPPWHSPHVPPEGRSHFQGRSYTKPIPPDTGEKRQQEHPRQDTCGQREKHFGERPVRHASNTYPENNPYRSRDTLCAKPHRKLVLLRGVPGSGKSTLARSLRDQSPYGIVFSTDDYFCQETGYTYDVKLLGDAHSWNQNRAKRAMDDGRSPIIIDNTNIQSWEMKPYVQMAIDRGYDVEILEPDTWWKMDPYELEKRNTHRVPREKISQMLERYQSNMTVSTIMNSVEPRHVRSSRPEARPGWGASVDCSHHSSSFHSG